MIRFDPYAVQPPTGSWDYVVDDKPIDRAPPGSPRLLSDARPCVRLGPDCAYRAWRNEYVLVHEEGERAPVLRIRGALYLWPRGGGADIVGFEATVHDPTGTPRFEVFTAASHARRAGLKALKVFDWYRAEWTRRVRGEPPMLTARELWGGGNVPKALAS